MKTCSQKNLRLLLPIGGLAVLLAGCGGGGEKATSLRSGFIDLSNGIAQSADDIAAVNAPAASGSSSGTGSAAASSGTASDASGSDSKVVVNLEAVDGAAMQVKNVNLLRSSISDCLDIEASNKGIFSINYDMKVGQVPADPVKGKVQFYNGDCAIGRDISDCLKGDLYDPDAVAGDTVSSNALSVGYLQALGTVANVIAHNCDTDSKCKCDDDKVAEGLIARCVPYLVDAAFDSAHNFLVQACKAPLGATAGDIARARRSGIANLIGSIGFAKARE